MTRTFENIQKVLRETLSPSHLEIEDNSAKHAGHAGARSGSGHYRVLVVSELFEGKSLIEQHRMVNEALRPLFKDEIHALALKTFSPSQWKPSP
jgi:BolA family transcriptional regulator, general stress-responsive regulator